MSDSRPVRPPGPKHVPFWPVLVAFAFMLAIVVSGFISSNHARSEHLTIVTSTLPPKGRAAAVAPSAAATATTATTSVAAATAKTDPGTNLAACSAANLVTAVIASGKVDPTVVGTYSAPQFRCVSGYALARLVPSKPTQQSVTADYKLSAGAWVLISVGDVNPLEDGVPADIAAQLVLS